MTKRNKPKPQPTVTTLEAVVADALAELQALGEELREWHDNMPENLQGGSKGEEVDEAASAIENAEGIDGIDIPEALRDLRVSYLIRGRARSRSDRRDEAITMLTAAVDALEARVEEQTQAKEDGSEAQDVADSIQAVIDEAEAVDFPGMY